MPEQLITIVSDPPAIYVAKDQPLVRSSADASAVTIQTREQLGAAAVPVPLYRESGLLKYLRSPNVSLVTEQGGRGPIFNEGQLITAGVLLGLLTDAVEETEFTPALRARLDAFTQTLVTLVQDVATITNDLTDTSDIVDIVNAQLENAVFSLNDPQEGFVTHDETVVLDFTWPGKLPLIELTPCQGLITKQATDTTDPDVHYVTIPDQELVYGHTGLVPTGVTADQYQFTAKAAILSYLAPVLNNLIWTSSSILASELLGITENSGACPLQSTSVPCMGFKVKGYLILRNSGGTKVSGAAYAQMSVDAGPWVNIARFKKTFQADDTVSTKKNFHVFVAHDQDDHDYQFRVHLEVDDSLETNRELTASMHVSTVAESGAGTVLTNNIQLKWAAKE